MATRRLAAIMATDVVGSSRMVEDDELGALSAIRAVISEVIEPAAARHFGRLIKTTGDGALVEFASPVEATTCAVEVQRAVAERAANQSENRRVLLRIGINLGDVVVEHDGDLYGDGVNVAVRLESIADPGGVCVSEKVYEELQGKIALPFEDRGEKHLKNIARPIRVYILAGNQPELGAQPDVSQPAHNVLDKPSIAVLPFTNLSEDPEQEYFSDGITEDLITALTWVKWFFVIARTSTFTYKGRSVDVKQIGRELGVRYVLEGSVRKAGSRLRITSQLADVSTGRQIWADRFEGKIEDIFDLQDQITERVVGAVEPSVRNAEIARSRAKPTASLDAYDLYLRALPHFYRMTPDSLGEAIRLLDRAIQADSTFAVAKALGSFTRHVRIAQACALPSDNDEAMRMSHEAVAGAPHDPTVLRLAGHVMAFCGRDYEAALSAIDLALILNQNSAQGYSSSGWVRLYVGDSNEGIAHFGRSMRLSPIDPERGITLTGISLGHLMQDRYDQGVTLAQTAVREMPYYLPALKTLIFGLSLQGNFEDARRTAIRLRQMAPKFSIAYQAKIIPFRDQMFCQRFLDALRLAGIPESPSGKKLNRLNRL